MRKKRNSLPNVGIVEVVVDKVHMYPGNLPPQSVQPYEIIELLVWIQRLITSDPIYFETDRDIRISIRIMDSDHYLELCCAQCT